MTVPIIGCTGNTLEKDLEIFRVSGCDRVIGKPFDSDLFHQYMTELTANANPNKKESSSMSDKNVSKYNSSNKVRTAFSSNPFHITTMTMYVVYLIYSDSKHHITSSIVFANNIHLIDATVNHINPLTVHHPSILPCGSILFRAMTKMTA